MITSLTIENFRLLKHLVLEDLGRINLITGKNNTGKTSVLEAIFLLQGAGNISLRFAIEGGRGIEQVNTTRESIAEVWELLFREFDIKTPITLAQIADGESQLKIEITQSDTNIHSLSTNSSMQNGVTTSTNYSTEQVQYTYTRGNKESNIGRAWIDNKDKRIRGEWEEPAPVIVKRATFGFARSRISPTDLANFFSLAVQLGHKGDIIAALQLIEPTITDIMLLTVASNPVIYGQMGKSCPSSLALMGDGLNRLLQVFLHMIFASEVDEGVVLIDEFENGFHYSTLPKIWDAIAQTAHRLNVQVFATTHSLECIHAAHQVFNAQDSYDFRLYRLDRSNKTGEISAVSYDQEVLEAALEMQLEVR